MFTGWYLDGHLLSTKQSLAFTAVRDADFKAEFATASTVDMPGGSDCGYSIYVDSADSEALDSLLNSGRISLEDVRSLNADKAGTSFDVAKDSTVTFKVEIKEGYEKSDDFKVKVNRSLLFTDSETGKYSFTSNAATMKVTVEGVRKIEPTPTPVINYMQYDDGSIVFQSYLTEEEEGEVTLTLCVNGEEVTTVEEIVEYTLTKEELDRYNGVFSVYATAKAEGKLISERATLNGSNSGSAIVIPVDIEDSENGSVEVDQKYNAPGTKAKLTLTPEEGYALDKLMIETEDGSTIEYTDKDLVESEDGTLEAVEEEGVYYFTRPSGKVTVRAAFRTIPRKYATK